MEHNNYKKWLKNVHIKKCHHCKMESIKHKKFYVNTILFSMFSLLVERKKIKLLFLSFSTVFRKVFTIFKHVFYFDNILKKMG